MRARILILVALGVILILPFWLRPKQARASVSDDTLVLITPHNEALRYEFGQGFKTWYHARTGRTVAVDWRVIGGTSEISRFLEGEYVSAFQAYWTQRLGRSWTIDVQAGFQNGKLSANAPDQAKQARAAFLDSQVGCGIDLFFGGGPYDFIRQAQAGRLVDSGIMKLHPEWFTDQVIPHDFAGEEYWDRKGLWIGTVLSSYGLLYNKDALTRLGVPEPRQWTDLKSPKLRGEIALADPTKSGSIAKVFENIVQQQMQRRLTALQGDNPGGDAAALEARAVREGWIEGLKLLQLIGANARYFTDTSQKPPIDVSQGDSAIGLCIDFYGRQQAEAVLRRGGSTRLVYISPRGGSVSSVDPIGLLRGAPHRAVAVAFIEYVLSGEGQRLWNYRPGTAGGPLRFALRRLPVRKDFYGQAEVKSKLSDPDDAPFEEVPERLVYRAGWTGSLFSEMSFAVRVMCLDTHTELVRAWKAVSDAGMPPQALATLQDMSHFAYDEVAGVIKQRLNAKDKVEQIELARDLGNAFREQYARAEALAAQGR